MVVLRHALSAQHSEIWTWTSDLSLIYNNILGVNNLVDNWSNAIGQIQMVWYGIVGFNVPIDRGEGPGSCKSQAQWATEAKLT